MQPALHRATHPLAGPSARRPTRPSTRPPAPLTRSPTRLLTPWFFSPWLACHMKRLAASAQLRSFSNVTMRPPGGSA